MPKKKAGGKKKGKGKKTKKASSSVAGRLLDYFKPVPKTPEESLEDGLKKLRWWMEEECANIDSYFQHSRKESFTVEEFTTALRYLQAPISSSQMSLLIKYLDNFHTGEIDISKFKKIHEQDDRHLLKISLTTSLADPVEEEPDDNKDNATDKKKKKKKKKKGDSAVTAAVKPTTTAERGVEYKPRFVDVRLILASFKDFRKHPGHFTVSVTTSTTIHGISTLIQTHLQGSISSIAVFKDASCSKKSYLNPSWTLESCGVEGSALKYEPATYELYYDYIPDIIDCPLLMTDISMRFVPSSSVKIT